MNTWPLWHHLDLNLEPRNPYLKLVSLLLLFYFIHTRFCTFYVIFTPLPKIFMTPRRDKFLEGRILWSWFRFRPHQFWMMFGNGRFERIQMHSRNDRTRRGRWCAYTYPYDPHNLIYKGPERGMWAMARLIVPTRTYIYTHQKQIDTPNRHSMYPAHTH